MCRTRRLEGKRRSWNVGGRRGLLMEGCGRRRSEVKLRGRLCVATRLAIVFMVASGHVLHANTSQP